MSYLVSCTSRGLNCRIRPVDECGHFRGVFLCICLLLVFGAVSHSTADPAPRQSQRLAVSTSGAQFAIADFDGDGRPDIATIEGGQSASDSASYSIELHLSGGPRQFIHLTLPAAGVAIEARDVNGDNTPDLLVVTRWFRQPLAIFLNVGHGSFQRVEPTAFRRVFDESNGFCCSLSNVKTELVNTWWQSRDDLWSDASELTGAISSLGKIAVSISSFVATCSLPRHTGRAPPLDILPI
jgi:hypothetical protein